MPSKNASNGADIHLGDHDDRHAGHLHVCLHERWCDMQILEPEFASIGWKHEQYT